MRTVDKAYYALIERMPLVRIGDDDHLREAGKLASELAVKDALNELSATEVEYLNVLSDLIVKYESDRFPRQKLTPVQMVEALMEANCMTQLDIAPLFGGQPRVSDFLMGKRELSKAQIAKLSQRFSMSPAAFFYSDET